MPAGVRSNGFQAPLSKDQVTSWVLQPLMMSCFIAFVAKLLDRDKCIGILVPTGVLIGIILGCWYICESRDPSVEKSKSAVSLLPVPSKMTRYCTLCCKTSPGLDHHCTWLNTCIADNNYEAFFFLVVAATLQTVLQAVIGVLMATIWFDEIKLQLSPSWHSPMRALLWVHNAIILSLANSYILLAGFHIYLVAIRSGTYDFILENGNDGICARMLKCKCFTKSKTKRKSAARGDKRRSMSKTSPSPASSKVVAAPARGTRADGLTPQEVSAAKQREVEQWKAEWIKKYGSDDDDKNSSTTAEQPQKPAEDSQSSGGTTTGNSAPSQRRATDPVVPHQTHDQVQIEMSVGINESEGIVQAMENGKVDGLLSASKTQPPARSSPSPRADGGARGAQTEL